ncbi:ankyrin [Apiospora hydei]|uniref:Ankyrin n=1 Tax=Apiospora hydei TaxID=1337664 RepID=A0ABR1W8N5_9PEZI
MPTTTSYKPIAADEFRVVHILPADDDDADAEVRCLLETRPPRLKTHYEALSYQWGDETVTRPIQIAHLPSPADRQRQPEAEATTITSFPPLRLQLQYFFSRVTKRLSSIPIPAPLRQTITRRLDALLFSLRALAWAAGTAALWHLISPLPVGPSDTLARLRVPRDAHLLFVCAVNGFGVVEYPVKAIQLLAEVWRTKPWRLAYRFRVGGGSDDSGGGGYFRFRRKKKKKKKKKDRGGEVGRRDECVCDSTLEFETFQATTNLVLALKRLRREKGVRTLWIDALCINQQDPEEKQVQIRRMGWVYANASPVLVTPNDEGNVRERRRGVGQEHCCRRELQIRAAFKFIKSQSGFRYRYFSQSMPSRDKRFQEARPGLIEIAKRGWWERLWVLQEVALATGHVQIQCGSSTCKLEQFMSVHIRITEEYCKEGQQDGEDMVLLKEAFGSSGRLIRAIRDFRYSYIKDRQGPLAKLSADMLSSGIRKITRGTSRRSACFHEQPFEDRLQRILLRTAGRFQCRDDRDRLYAILGIAGGVTIGETNRLARFMDFISNFSTGTVIARSIDDVLKMSSPSSLGGWLPTACTALVLAHTIWDMFYESEAKHWTINRPDYVVTEYEDIIGAIADVPKRQGSAEFFTALARLLAHATKSLTFLDAVAFKEESGGREGMPSWVPNWAREIDSDAYKHSIRTRGDDAQDLFHFIDGGKALQLVGRLVGRVEAIKSLSHAMLLSSPQSFASEKYLALPQKGKTSWQGR